MDRKGIEKDKWAQTGWRIEQRYGNRVLIGNWAEERRQFTREPKIANSISRVDYRPHWDFKPDVFERRSALLRAEGLPYRILFDQHSSLPSHYLAEDYEQRNAHKPSSSLPAIQLWNPNMTFQSERFDKPISALSSHACIANRNNKDLNLRENPYLQVPDECFRQDVITNWQKKCG